jgi:cyclase
MKTPAFPSLAICLIAGLNAAAQTPEPFLLKPLGPGTFAAIDNPSAQSEQSGSNAGVVIGPAGVLVVDTFENAPAAEKLLASIRQQTPLPIRFVVNTHYHLDHVSGNQVFATVGATILAQQNVRRWERTENLKFFGEHPTPNQRASVEALRLPDIAYTQPLTLYLGPNLKDARPILLRPMPGHTGGDTVVYDAQSNTVFCGDLFWNHTLPNLIDASTKPWIETLDILLADYPTATFVPGHGDNPGRAADVRAFRDYLAFLRDAIAQAQATGATSQAVLQQVLPQIKAKYGDWAYFDFATPDIERTDEELRGTKRLPTP